MRAPGFWAADESGVAAVLLSPLGWLYATVGRARRRLAGPGYRATIPVICIGNATLGGAGKTPTALAIAAYLIDQGADVHFLIRGYGGREAGPLAVDPGRHSATNVGDEALLLAARAPTWVSADRAAGARAIEKAGADIIVMDDGHQNMSLVKDLSILVVDGGFGIGNGRVFPSGPLREPWSDACARAETVLIVGDDETGVSRLIPDPPLSARLAPAPDHGLEAGTRVLAFAGIGRPAKFFDTVRGLGLDVQEERAFPDHHPFTEKDWRAIRDRAEALGARPVTTEKDAVRLPEGARGEVTVIHATLIFDDPKLPAALLNDLLSASIQGWD